MKKGGAVWIAVSCVLSLCLIFGGLAHAFIAHDDGDSHHHGLGIIAGSLHSALMHEDKKIAALVALVWIFAFFTLRPAIVSTHIALLARLEGAYIHRKDKRLLLLRGGVLPYRRFS